MNCTFFVRVNIRRPFDSYLWLNCNNNQRHWNAVLNAISEKENLANAIKDGKNFPATKYISLISLVVSKEKRPEPTTVGDKQGHEQSFCALTFRASGDNKSQE